MRRITRVLVFAMGLAGCGGGGEETPVVDSGSPADDGGIAVTDRGEVPAAEVAGEAEVSPPDAREAEVTDVCAQWTCEETYKVFPNLDDQGSPMQVCFRWTCDPVRGQCVVEFLQGVRCDDGLDCTRMDTCVDGRCVGLVDECTCNGGTGECSDGDPCTTDDSCAPNGKCLAGPEKDCTGYEAEAGDCRTVACFLGVCMWSPRPEGEPCASPNRCFARGQCDGRGHCVEDLEAPQNCDDQNPCTTDGCDVAHPGAAPETGCYHEPNSDPCDDGNACTEDDRCEGGACTGSPVDCEDGNPCTDDRPETCDAKTGCQHPKLPDHTACDDQSECTPSSRCLNGLCLGEINCDDGDQCTDDSCGVDKKCRHARHTRPCNDGDPCTQEDRCGQDGQCRGVPVPCPGNTCNDGACEVVAGQGTCVLKPKPAGTKCDDGNGCTTGDVCGAPGPDGTASCKGQSVTCAEKADDCNEGVCIPVDPQTYVCVANPKVGKPPCEDKDLCTVGDYCQYGKCVSGGPRMCEPATDACEQNRCDPSTGKCVLSLKTGSCSDGNACTVGDVCVAGASPEEGPGKCVGTLINCNDLNVCTLDTCDQDLGCRHAPRIKECSNATGVACWTDTDCAGGGTCVEVGCQGDGNPCTRDVCAEDGTCQHVGRYKECKDGRPCTTDADCAVGEGPCAPVGCADDGVSCTVDLCWWDGTCQHFQRVKACADGIPCLSDADCGGAPGSCGDVGPVPCDDQDKCTIGEVCTLQGTCEGTPRDCTDHETLPSGPTVENVCTDDFCDQKNPAADPATGCYHVFNSNPCDDRDPCTRAEKCSGALCDACFFGHCQGPIPRDCADANPCTLDGCDQFHPGADANGCWHDRAAPGTSCDDLNLCTFNDRCDAAGVCGGQAVDCNDENECTNEIGCDPVNGCIRTLAKNGTACDDSNACTLGDRCFAGVCSGPNAVNCNDSNPCTVDWCLPTEGCQHEAYTCDDGFSCTTDTCKGDGSCQFTLKSGWCLIDGVCYSTGTLNPANDCQACNPSLSTSAWSNLGSGVACADDGVSCTVDQCNGLGTCIHPIASESCRISGVCYARNDLNPEKDCQSCNPTLSQTVWSNLANGAPCGDDGVSCTVDQCNGLGTCIHPIASESCRISGVCYARNDLNPEKDCQECNPILSQTAWSNRGSGASCAEDGDWCTTDQCDGFGTCTHTTATETCKIQGVCYGAGVVNPANDCQECNPALSKSSWSSRTAGTTCADDGVPCTLNQCNGLGSCTHPIANTSCRISNVCYEAGTLNVANDCQECNPTLSQTAWSNRGSGASCADDGISCTLDQCNGFGVCQHNLASDKCRIDGVCYASGTTNPQNPCQVCNPIQSQASWSNKASGTSCNDGENLDCTNDVCNADGQCTHPVKSGYCLIGGQCKDNGAQNPDNQCQECNPAQNPVAWSAKSNGTLCSDNNACTITDVCFNGACQPGSAKTCTALDQCHYAGTCDPANGVCSNQPKPNDTPCNDGNPCTVGESCQAGACTGGTSVICNDGNPCTEDQCALGTGCYYSPKTDGTDCSSECAENATCQQGLCQGTFKSYGVACTSDAYGCTDDICNGAGVCTHPIQAGKCLINGTCRNNGDLNPANDCQACVASQSQTQWSDRAAGSPCNDNMYCNGTDTCNGSGSCANHSGNPCPGHNAGPNCNDSCNEAADNCTAADQAGTSCDDSIYCNGTDTCNASGSCANHSGNPCPGHNTGPNCNDSCNEAADNCTAADQAGTSCDDSQYCNGTDTCNASGSCTNHAGNPCPGHNVGPNCNDSCNEAADNCTAADQAGTSCDDSQYCNGTDTCNASGSCANHSGNPCPGHNVGPACDDSCNEAADNCTAADQAGTSCDDSQYCNGADTCDGSGSCANHAGNPCSGHNVGPTCNDSCNETSDECNANDQDGTPCGDSMICCGGACMSECP